LSAVKPLLVCGDSWVIRQTLNDQALNIDGMDRVIRITNKNGEPVLLGDDENYSIIVEENTAKLARQIFLVSRLLETQACILNYADG
jgi:PHD/YefM family antitoxin component YafN of YafNO toxin-antitoxin module